MLLAYPRHASVAQGGRLTLHVSTDRPRFRVHIFRWDGRLQALWQSGWLPGKHVAPRAPDEDWQWPAYTVPVGAGWPSGVYLAFFEDDGPLSCSLAQASHAALFVVRGPARSGLLYKIGLATFHAYNFSGGGCFYANPPRAQGGLGARLSFQRPGGGIGGPVWCAPDFYDASSPRQTFAHWDAPFIGWLLRHGYASEFCTDADLHADPALCQRYRLLLSVGHDEYWSIAMRNQVEAFIAGGGNVAFFSANLCWWRIHPVERGAAMVCHQGGPNGARDHWWPQRPEDGLAGVSYRHGGGWWDGPRESTGYVVVDPAHWVFAGTGLQRGQRFGADTLPPLVGYECDGAPLASFDSATGNAELAANPVGGVASAFRLLAASELGKGWQERPPHQPCGAQRDIHAATMGLCERGGTVFTAGTTDWAQVLAAGGAPEVERITHNVVDRLLGTGTARHA